MIIRIFGHFLLVLCEFRINVQSSILFSTIFLYIWHFYFSVIGPVSFLFPESCSHSCTVSWGDSLYANKRRRARQGRRRKWSLTNKTCLRQKDTFSHGPWQRRADVLVSHGLESLALTWKALRLSPKKQLTPQLDGVRCYRCSEAVRVTLLSEIISTVQFLNSDGNFSPTIGDSLHRWPMEEACPCLFGHHYLYSDVQYHTQGGLANNPGTIKNCLCSSSYQHECVLVLLGTCAGCSSETVCQHFSSAWRKLFLKTTGPLSLLLSAFSLLR